MIRVVVSTNAAGATKYFTDALSVGDYYAEGQKCQGIWHGKGAEILGIKGEGISDSVTREQFRSMAFNEHPTEGGPLTQRTMTNRRVGYDINFHAPKSLSIRYGLTGDDRLLQAFRWAVNDTMEQMESEMKSRVRVDGGQWDRTVGNLCWAEFIHFTARPVDGWPDPHLHAHCFTFNAVFDEVEMKWKAGQFGDLKRDAPFFEACFHARLASKLVELGYPIERREKSWEIAFVPQEENRKFSRRTAEIEAAAEKLGIHDDKRKSDLGAKTRNRKDESRPIDELRKEWAERIEPSVREQILRPVIAGKGTFGRGIEQTVESSVDLALSTTFERQSVVSEQRCMTAALRNSLGSLTVTELQEQLEGDSRVIRKDIDNVLMVTTQEVMEEERRMIAFARDGRGTRNPIAPDHLIKDQKLNDHQRAAVIDVLSSTDLVQIVKGGAGTGKTTLMTEAVEAIKEALLVQKIKSGEPVTLLAQSADASRGVLRSEGFSNAETVAKFLVSPRMQEDARGGILWVDEAGLLGSRMMVALCDVASRVNARLILSGDPGQHRAVERGDPLGLFVEYAGVNPIAVSKVVRQHGLYKSAVEHLAAGESEKGFEGLRKLGCIREMDESDAHKEIAYNFANSVEYGRSALVVSPTHAEGARVTARIREELKRRSIIAAEGRPFDHLEDLRLTEGEKARANRYENGEVIQFHQNVSGFKAGVRYHVTTNLPGIGVILDNGLPLPVGNADKFSVYKNHEKAVEFCVGDTIRITANGKTLPDEPEGKTTHRPHAVNNGAVYHVAGFTKNGDIRLDNGWTISQDFGHLNHGYCTTSHSSQGKTVDTVFIAQSENSFGATSAEQFYVSVSRGRTECFVYTDDVEGLQCRIQETQQRTPAVTLSDEVQKSVATERERAALANARRVEEERASQWREMKGPRFSDYRETGGDAYAF